MERLTKEFTSCEYCEDMDCTGYKNSCMHRKVYEKLAHYEDLAEQGRLIELPCVPNETVWCADEYNTRPVLYGSKSSILHDIECFKGIGYTKEAAEANLKELRGEQE